ncbi:DMT family transporter [Erysipelotrichaceae bacterium RD49]|nr:DMT family transporter [Erysipelotrichaceae bacterium RD49]
MLCGLLGGCLWALDTVLLSIAMAPFELEWTAPIISTGLHDLFSALWMSGLITIKKKWPAIRKALQSRSGWMVVAAALLGGPVGMCGYVFAVQFLGPSLTAGISAFYPALSAVLCWIFFGQKLRKSQVGGLGLCLGCIVAMSASSPQQGSNFGLGLLMAIGCVVGWALEGVIVQHSMKEDLDNEICLFLRQTTSAAAFSFLIIPLVSSWQFASTVLSTSWELLLAASFCGTASYLSYYKAIGWIGANKAMPLNSTYCAWAVVFALVLQGTIPTLLQVILCIGILAGAILCAHEPGAFQAQ